MKKIAIIGQGYVGLPLALELSKYHPVIGFDINETRVEELNQSLDRTKEVDEKELDKAIDQARKTDFTLGYMASSHMDDLQKAQIYIVTVPTPINEFNAPNLEPLRKASKMIAEYLSPGDIVIYESTVYPGCTEEECIPILEEGSAMVLNRDFYVGYSPERIIPGDKVNTLTQIKKVTSGSCEYAAEEIDALYRQIITAGTHKATSIKVAEASKAIENAQRDVNISFINELALIFDRVGIDTNEVLEAAGTKFNFLKYQPGLVGGHCISVDPYYLAHKAVQLGYHPNVILSGRRVNDSIPEFVASKVVKLMIQKNISVKDSKILILGVTFKENCPDLRNTKIVDVYQELTQYGATVDLYDPWADPKEVEKAFGAPLLPEIQNTKYDAVILAVAHNEFFSVDIEEITNSRSVVFDIKAKLNRDLVDARL